MTRRLGLRLLPVLLPVLLAAPLLLPGPAAAVGWTAADPAGDAVSTTYSPEPEPCGTTTQEPTTEGDVVRVRARHGRERVLLAVDVTGLTVARRTLADFTVVTPERDFSVSVDRFARRTQVAITRYPDVDEDDADECGGFAWFSAVASCPGATGTIDVTGGRIAVSLPRRCLGTPRWVRVGAAVYGGGVRSNFDQWLPRGHDGDPFAPAVGRRVLAGPPR